MTQPLLRRFVGEHSDRMPRTPRSFEVFESRERREKDVPHQVIVWTRCPSRRSDDGAAVGTCTTGNGVDYWPRGIFTRAEAELTAALHGWDFTVDRRWR